MASQEPAVGVASRGDAGEDAAASPVKVVICGAGPAGLLLAHYLLAFGRGKFRVVIRDKAEDPRETLKLGLNYRRYSIGISIRGEGSIQAVPGLLEKVKNVTVVPEEFSMLLPFLKKPVRGRSTPKERASGWLVDRCSLCASLVTALVELHSDSLASGKLQLHFRSACTGVSLEDQVATFLPQGQPGEEPAAPVTERYDLLVGADGLRSAVRLAFQQQIRGFEVQQRALAGSWTVAHFDPPKEYPRTFHMMPLVPKSGGMTALGLPSPAGEVCFILGWMRNDNVEQWSACKTPQAAKAFIDARLPYFNMPEEAAWQLRSAPVQSSMEVKCWQYHDTKGHAVLIGDAAHATAPAIGQGCNASLVDAAVLARLLLGEVVGEDNRVPARGDAILQGKMWGSDPSPADIRKRLPSLLQYFSALQVKEGHALVDLSSANGPITPLFRVLHAILFMLQATLAKLLPFIFSPPVMSLAGTCTTPYSKIYDLFRWQTDLFLWSNERTRQGWLQSDFGDLKLKQN